MLTGKRAFEGKSQLSVASAILDKEPEPLNKTQPLTPPALERIVSKCLSKDPEERWQSARDLASELRWIREGGTVQPAVTPAVAPRKRRELLLVAGLAVTSLLAIVFAVLFWRAATSPARPIVAEITPPPNTRFSFVGPSSGVPAVAPDGHALSFCALDEAGKSKLWVHTLDSGTAHSLAGTEGAGSPFWSPDSRSLGFFAEGALKTIDSSGGPAFTVAPVPLEGQGSWGRDGTILFTCYDRAGFCRVAASGGNPAQVLTVDTSKTVGWAGPTFLPDGRHFLFWAGFGDPAFQGTYFASLDGKEKRLLVQDTAGPAFASGFLLDIRAGALMAQSLDPIRGQLNGDPLPVVRSVGTGFNSALFDTSQNGILVYEPSNLSAKRLLWFDRAGKNLSAVSEAGDYYDLRLSPDGRKLAVNAGYPPGGTNSEIWVDEFARSVHMRLTIDPDTDHGIPVWSPDGTRIAFGALQGKARRGIYLKAANGAGGEELILPVEDSTMQVWPTSWSRDGGFILYTHGNISLSTADIWVLPIAGDRKPRLFIKAPGPAYDGQFSPNGRWVAYSSRESGRDEVYVAPFNAKTLGPVEATSAGGGKWLISANGGTVPRWRGDGKEIFFLSPSSHLMAVPVAENGNSLEVGPAQVLFRASVMNASFAPYDVASDGTKFIINSQGEYNNPLTLLVNWTALLKKK